MTSQDMSSLTTFEAQTQAGHLSSSSARRWSDTVFLLYYDEIHNKSKSQDKVLSPPSYCGIIM